MSAVGLCYTPGVLGGLVLASASPRRREILRRVGARFEAVPPAPGAETAPPRTLDVEGAVRWVEGQAEAKARSVVGGCRAGSVVVGADTVVLLGDRLLGKPAGPGEAGEMLRALSGRVHRVLTGVAVLVVGGEAATACGDTQVRFRPLAEGEIRAYVASGEPLGKAGAYAIQGLGGLLVEGIEGCYYNVVGLPLALLYRMLRERGVDLLRPGR